MLLESIKEVKLLSDCCSGQTHNIYFAVMCLVVTQERQFVLNHKFLQPGHTHMEVDSTHALIDVEKQKISFSIEIRRDWMNFIKSIQNKRKLEIIAMEQKEFLQFSALLKGTGPFVHRKVDVKADAVKWLRIKWMQYRQDNPYSLFYKFDFKEETFKEVNLECKKRMRSAMRRKI